MLSKSKSSYNSAWIWTVTFDIWRNLISPDQECIRMNTEDALEFWLSWKCSAKLQFNGSLNFCRKTKSPGNKNNHFRLKRNQSWSNLLPHYAQKFPLTVSLECFIVLWISSWLLTVLFPKTGKSGLYSSVYGNGVHRHLPQMTKKA